jgi:DHA1 family multidrug resistance protein-like MFS transporter
MTAKHQYWFIVGRILPALFKCGMGVPNAYVSDVSLTSLELTTNLGRLQAAMALGLILGPVIGGYFAKYDVNLPLMFSSVALILSMIFLLYVKESKSKGVSKDKPQRRPSTTTLTHDLTSLSRTQLLHMKFAFQVGNAMFELFLVPYVRRQLHLGEHHIGYVLGFYGLIALISNALVVQLAAKFSATHLLMVVFLHSIGLLGWGMSQHIVLTLVAITIIAITSCLYLNIVQTLIAELGNSSNAGATMGISSTVDRAARIIAPLIGGFALQESSPVSIGVAAFGFGVYSAAVLAYSSSSSALKERRKVE